MIGISEEIEAFVDNVFPKLGHELKLAQMKDNPTVFVRKAVMFSLIFAVNLTVPIFFLLLKFGVVFFAPMAFIFLFTMTLLFALQIPRINIHKVREEIEGDIFVPAWKMLTLIEAGNSIISALIGASYSKAKSAKYFGKIASEIFLGKTIERAFDDAIKYTPSESFRRVLEPVKKSLKTGADIKANLVSTLNELSQEKAVEIELYEKKLSPVSMFYLLVGTIIPALMVIAGALIISFIGLEVRFFPFLFIYLIIIVLIQVLFINLFRSLRPMVKL